MSEEIHRGLKGVYFDRSRVCFIDGRAGELRYRGYSIHDLAELAIDPAAEGVQVVVSGHSHRPKAQAQGGVWYVNPGSAGPPRFRLPISAAELQVDGGVITPRLVELVKR